MIFETPLISGTLIKRYKRFLADVLLLDGTIVTAHCANSGAMLGLTSPGIRVWLSPQFKPERTLKYSWELAEVDWGIVGVNTSHPNTIAEEAIKDGTITELQGYAELKREVKYGTNSRIDILLTGNGRETCYVEVKNVHLLREGIVSFPDSVTARGKKHLEELSLIVQNGGRAVMLYIIQRNDSKKFNIARDIDPAYFDAYLKATKAGVEVLAYTCKITPEEIKLSQRIDVID